MQPLSGMRHATKLLPKWESEMGSKTPTLSDANAKDFKDWVGSRLDGWRESWLGTSKSNCCNYQATWMWLCARVFRQDMNRWKQK